MSLSEALEGWLLRYVDGQLDAVEKAEVETLLRQDPQAAAFVRLLKAGDLPYVDAFAPVLSEPVPESFVEYIRSKSDNEKSS